MDDFIRQTLTISVAQIIENIGWHSITDSSMKIMTDILYHYISDLSITSKKYAEHAYCDVPDIEDVEKAFRHKSISLTELRRYIKSTGPVKFPHSLPILMVPGKNAFNTIKPGSREIVTRPIHIHEHLPTLYSEPTEEEQTTDTEQIQNSITNKKEETEEIILHKRLREISSVVMTSGGFLSPSREGRLAESKLLPFPEIKNDKPLESSKSSIISPNIEKEPSRKTSTGKKKIKTKKLKSGIKKKPKGSKKQMLLVLPKEKKPEVLKKTKKSREKEILSPKKLVSEPVIEEIDVVNVTEEVQLPKQVIPLIPQTHKVKLEEVLPKFSFFGPLPQSSGLIPSTPHHLSPIITPDKIEKPTSPVLKIENEDLSRKEQKKKKKDKKKEKKEKKKQKDKVKEKAKEKEKIKEKGKVKEKEKIKEKEEKKEKLKCTNKVPKIKLRFGTRMDKVTKVLPVNKPAEENISIVTEPEPMEVDVDIESKSDIPIEVLQEIKSPPKVPTQKIKTKIITKITQPTPAPVSIPTPVAETPPPAFYFDEAGNQVWICPMCTKPDDGSPMIGCDGCDVWYHWVCVGIQCPPDCAVWYCPRCLAKRAQQPKGKRGRPRKNKS